MKSHSIASLVAALLLLAACGGGGGQDGTSPQADDPLVAVPSRASESPQGLMSYLRSLLPLDAQAREPVPVNAFVPPISEDAEPQDVDG